MYDTVKALHLKHQISQKYNKSTSEILIRQQFLEIIKIHSVLSDTKCTDKTSPINMHFIQNLQNSPFCCLLLSIIIDIVQCHDLTIFLFKACGIVKVRYRVQDTTVNRFNQFRI